MSEPQGRLLQEALAGRLPVLPQERIYNTYASLLWTTAVLSSASWVYLIGSQFPSYGNTWLSIIGYLIGLIIGEVVVVVAVGIPSYRYGVDSIDIAKAALGSRGCVVILIAVMGASLGWAYVLMAMTARGIGRLERIADAPAAALSEPTVTVAAIALLVLIWYFVRRGPAAMERLSRVCVPGQIVIGLLILALLVGKFGASALAGHGVPPGSAVTTDPLEQIAYAVEFGFDNALGLLPFLGGLTRLVGHKRHLVGATVMGSGVIGASLIASVAALGADVMADHDPISWIVQLTGPVIGSVIVGFLMIANLGTLVVLVYVASVSIQQIRALAAWRWEWVIALTLAPGILFAFRTEWLLNHVMTWLAYNGVMFVGLAAVLSTDYFCLRRQRLSVADLFARPHQGIYWFSGGVNWIAMAVILAAAGMYLALFDPVSLHVQPLFRYLGAGIPAVVTAGVLYYVLMRLTRAAEPRELATSKSKALEVGL
jgi:nucleobase:cation symporter-1, NCS1 family